MLRLNQLYRVVIDGSDYVDGNRNTGLREGTLLRCIDPQRRHGNGHRYPLFYDTREERNRAVNPARLAPANTLPGEEGRL